MENQGWQFDPWMRQQPMLGHHHPSDDSDTAFSPSHDLEVVHQSSHGHSGKYLKSQVTVTVVPATELNFFFGFTEVHDNQDSSYTESASGPDLFYGPIRHDQPEGSDLSVNAQVRHPGLDLHDGVRGQSFLWGGPGHDAVTPGQCVQVHLVDSDIQGRGGSIPSVQSPLAYIPTASYGRFSSCTLSLSSQI